MKRKVSRKKTRKDAADLRAFKDFSSGSKIQDAIMALLLRDSISGWLPRKDIVNRLVERGALRSTTSSEVARIQVQKALDALDKKLAQFNEDHGTSWTIERRKGKGLRLIEQHETSIASASSEAGKKGRGTGKSSVRQKLTAPRGAMVTVQRQRRSDGSFLVKVVHVEKEGAERKTGMITTHPKEEDAIQKFEELVRLAQEAGWTLVPRKKGKLPSSQFNEIPQAE